MICSQITKKRKLDSQQLHRAMISSINDDSHLEVKESSTAQRKEIPIPVAETNAPIASSTYSKSLSNEASYHAGNNSTLLASDFQPSPYTVVVGRGKIVQENIGNQRLRVLASIYAAKYGEATERKTKIQIVDEINKTIRSAGGMFVRRDNQGRWYRVSGTVVREKIGYVLRDLLSDNYKSSSKSKVATRVRKRMEQDLINSDILVPLGADNLAASPQQLSMNQRDGNDLLPENFVANPPHPVDGLMDSILDDFDADLLLKSPLPDP